MQCCAAIKNKGGGWRALARAKKSPQRPVIEDAFLGDYYNER
jgi:hypothetical protein